MVYLLRITLGNQGVIVVWFEGKHPEIFTFDSAYDALLFERSVGAQVALITHGRNRLIPVRRDEVQGASDATQVGREQGRGAVGMGEPGAAAVPVGDAARAGAR
jgi:hypothetical protein